MNSARHHVVTAALAGLLCAAAFALASYPVLRSAWFGVSELQDDSFYYLVTAKNFLRHGFFTFDGVNATNGFQPLWMACVVALYGLVGVDAPLDLQIFAVNAMERIALAGAIAASVGLYAVFRRRGSPWAVGFLAVSVLLLCPFYVIFAQGMETTLAILLLLLVAYAFLADRSVLLGICLALLFLCRLDTAVFVAAPMLAWHIARSPARRDRWIAACIFGAVFLAYAGTNLLMTGHVVPISGAIKSSFPAVRWQGAFFLEPITLARMFGWSGLVRGINMVECSALIAAGVVLTAIAAPGNEVRRKLIVLGAIAALLVANLLLFQKWDKSLDPRYLAMPMTMAILFAGSALGCAMSRAKDRLQQPLEASRSLAPQHARQPDAARRVAAACLDAAPLALIGVLLALEAAAHLSAFRVLSERRDDLVREIFREVAQTLPSDAVVAGTDVGALGFWTQRRVVNLDGVINNFGYQEFLRTGRLRDYLRQQGVTHLATVLWDREQTYTGRPIERMYRQVLDPPAVHGTDYKQHEFFVYSYVYGVYSDRIALGPRDEVYRRFVGKDGIADAAYVIYRLPGASNAKNGRD